MKTLHLKKENQIKGQSPIMTGEVDTENGYFIVTENGINYSYELRLFEGFTTVTAKTEPKKEKITTPKVKKERKKRESKEYEYRFYGAWGNDKDCFAAIETSFIWAAKSVNQQDSTFFEHDWNHLYTKHDIKTGQTLHSKKCKVRPFI